MSYYVVFGLDTRRASILAIYSIVIFALSVAVICIDGASSYEAIIVKQITNFCTTERDFSIPVDFESIMMRKLLP